VHLVSNYPIRLDLTNVALGILLNGEDIFEDITLKNSCAFFCDMYYTDYYTVCVLKCIEDTVQYEDFYTSADFHEHFLCALIDYKLAR